MITKNNLVSGGICGIICVAFMWVYMHFAMAPMGMKMDHGSMDMMNMTMNDMVKMMDGKTGAALEKEFIVGMIPHHQGAVDMAKKLLADKTISLEMKKFAEQIISAQESEIKMMNEWLKKY